MESAVRDGAAQSADIKYAVGRSSLATFVVATSATGVCAILMGDEPASLIRNLDERFPNARIVEAQGDLGSLVDRVARFIDSPHVGLDAPLDARGTEFQRRGWRALRKVPVGATVTYTDIAAEIGAPRSVRAVAQACGANPIAVAIPCHRVVRSDGGLSGYRWGVERKHALLVREGAR